MRHGHTMTVALYLGYLQFLVDNVIVQAFAASCSVFGISVLPHAMVAHWSDVPSHLNSFNNESLARNLQGRDDENAGWPCHQPDHPWYP